MCRAPTAWCSLTLSNYLPNISWHCFAAASPIGSTRALRTMAAAGQPPFQLRYQTTIPRRRQSVSQMAIWFLHLITARLQRAEERPRLLPGGHYPWLYQSMAAEHGHGFGMLKAQTNRHGDLCQMSWQESTYAALKRRFSNICTPMNTPRSLKRPMASFTCRIPFAVEPSNMPRSTRNGLKAEAHEACSKEIKAVRDES